VSLILQYPNENKTGNQSGFFVTSMMNIRLIFAIAFFFFIKPDFVSAVVTNEDVTLTDDTSNFREYDFSIEYGNTRLYRGIKSSSHPYLKPSFVYAAPAGFYAGIGSYFPLDSGNIDETDLNAGYEFELSKKTTLSFELIHYFINNNQLANAYIKNEAELYFRHNFGNFLRTKIYLDADFGKATKDYSVTINNSHEFAFNNAFAEDSKLLIIPEFSISAGTLNLVRKVKKDILSTEFSLTNYMLSIDVEYETGPFIFSTEAAYDFPIDKKVQALQKNFKSDPVFYFTASITYVID
jgi:hypothetical protein